MRPFLFTLCLIGSSLANPNVIGAINVFQYEDGRLPKIRGLAPGFQSKRLSIGLEERQSCAADCHGFCAAPTDVCCSNGRTCPAGYNCCGTVNCSPVDATCCPTGYYANPGEHCCPDSGSCPDGTTCDGAFCREGSQTGATGSTGGSAPTLITSAPPLPTSNVLTTASTATYWQWYTFTATWYYFSYYFEYDVIVHESTETSTQITTTTLLSISTSNSAAASAWFASVTAVTTFPTPADATPLPTSAPSTSSPTSTTPIASFPIAPTSSSTGPQFQGVPASAAGRSLDGLGVFGKSILVFAGLFSVGALAVWL